ncbi:unnamed protein product [Leuciscus chuanchicus]
MSRGVTGTGRVICSVGVREPLAVLRRHLRSTCGPAYTLRSSLKVSARCATESAAPGFLSWCANDALPGCPATCGQPDRNPDPVSISHATRTPKRGARPGSENNTVSFKRNN